MELNENSWEFLECQITGGGTMVEKTEWQSESEMMECDCQATRGREKETAWLLIRLE